MKERFKEEDFNKAKSIVLFDLECYQCGNIFQKSKSQIKSGRKVNSKNKIKYCSRKCSSESYKRKVVINCTFCDEEIEKRPCDINRNNNNFCSHSCSATYNNLGNQKADRRDCLNCQKKTLNKKYCSNKCQSGYEWKEKIKLIELGEEFATNENSCRIFAKRYLIEKNGHECCRCKSTEWMGEPIPLTCDHIDGDSTHNRIQNFRLLCANCDRQMPTFGSRNIGNGRKNRKENRLK